MRDDREPDSIRGATTDHAGPVERIHSDAVPFVHGQVIGIWPQTILWIIACYTGVRIILQGVKTPAAGYRIPSLGDTDTFVERGLVMFCA